MKKIKNLLVFILAFYIITAFRADHRPVVFLIGDSISMGYGGYLEHNLDQQIRIEHKAEEGASKNLDIPTGANRGDSKMLLTYLKEKIKDPAFHPAYLLLNCGLHDIKRNPKTGTIAVEPDAYKWNLQDIYQFISAKKIGLIRITTTEIIDSLHNRKEMGFYWNVQDVDQYNHTTSDYWYQQKIPQINLYAFTKCQRAGRFKDHAHYYADVCALSGAFVTGQPGSNHLC